ncbi:MAG: pilus assembly protein PilM [Kiritimatiellae bacterium]|nr:pilus assembly protein PilM [Kiritimatiellia bacterium]
MNGRILALDAGASKIYLSEFTVKAGAPVLTAFASAERDPVAAGASRNEPLVALADTVKEMMAGAGIKPAPLCVMLSGQQVFLRFAKIAGGSPALVEGMIRDEAAEHLPFPLDQVVWNGARLGEDPDTGEIDVLVVAAKSETAADAAGLAEALGLPLAAVDAVPLALCNAVRRSQPDAEGCTLVLDVGARATNLVFLEGGKVFLRTIPIAGNTMTQDMARSLGADAADAEAYKKQSAFVAQGGTAVADDEAADRASKVLRTVATRLHSEVTRSINFYRGQQGGSAPDRVLLTGGGALMRGLDAFLREKLGVPVDFFNPFENMAVAPGVQADDTALYLLAPSTGVAWREAGGCPVEINLVPPEIVARRRMRARIPFFGASVAAVVLSLAFLGGWAGSLASSRERQAEQVSAKVAKLRSVEKGLASALSESRTAATEAEAWEAMAFSRSSYALAIEAVRHALLRGTWVVSASFGQPSGGDDGDSDDSGPSYGTLNLVVRGFKAELDKLPGKGSAGEKFLSNLRRTPFFKGGAVKLEPVLDGGRITEIRLAVDLARPLGKFDASWIPEPKGAAPAGEGADKGAAADEEDIS